MPHKLTAEQVHDAIFNGSSYASYDGVKYYADGIHMQEIADELNTTLGAGTCRNIDDDCDSYFECSECGCHVLCDFYGSGYGKPRFCPNCGAMVVDE